MPKQEPRIRNAADLSSHPDLVVVYLGMRVYSLRGLATILSLRREVRKAVAQNPHGLLLHESFYFSLIPLHIGLRQYWRDFISLEAWTRSFPHQAWWKKYLEDPAGTGFWHETYCLGGGMEGIYDHMREPIGLLRFARTVDPVDRMFSAAERLDAAIAKGESRLRK